jgi:TIGR03009 family protein
MSWASLSAAVLLALAQPAAPQPADPKLEPHLAGWGKATQNLSTFRAEFTLTRTDAVFKRAKEYKGTILLARTGAFSVRVEHKADPTDWEEYAYDGKAVYEVSSKEKTIAEFKPGVLWARDENIVAGLCGGLKVEDMRKRFAVTLLQEDKNYVYLGIKPTQPKDKQEFEQAVLTLYGPKVPAPYTPYLPVMAQVVKPNGDSEKWVLNSPEANPKGVTAKSFAPRELPGFKRTVVTENPLLPPSKAPPGRP